MIKIIKKIGFWIAYPFLLFTLVVVYFFEKDKNICSCGSGKKWERCCGKEVK